MKIITPEQTKNPSTICQVLPSGMFRTRTWRRPVDDVVDDDDGDDIFQKI